MTQLTGQPGATGEPIHHRSGRAAQDSMLRQALRELLGYWSARIGLAWVGVLVLCAVFAPFIANSHPLVMRTAESPDRLTILSQYEPGTWSSPLLRHLTAADVLLPVVLLGVLAALLWRRVNDGQRMLAVFCFVGTVVVLGLWREHLAPFITSGHDTWWPLWQDWRTGHVRMAGVPPRAPVGPFVWWVLLWSGLVLMMATTALTTAGLVVSSLGVTDRIRGYWFTLVGVVGGGALWVACLVVFGVGAWIAGLALLGAVVVAVALRSKAGAIRVLGPSLLAAALLIGGWMVHAPVTPPRLSVLDQYREAHRAGEIQFARYTPIPFSPDDRLRDQRGMRFQPPGSSHLLGTTQYSADLAANLIHGTRIALSVGFIATGIAIIIGVTVGGIMGYFAGIWDLLGMRFVEMFSAIPTLFLLLAFVAAFGANLYIIMIIIGLTGWVGYAVFIRAEFLRLRQQDFVIAAQALGLPLWVIILRHLLPNGIAPLLVTASFGVAGAIGYEATLSFLGIGLDTEASWGLLLEQALRGGSFNWWIALYPGFAIFLTVFAYILVGEALRDALDPRQRFGAR
jgi:peptide/nickel transport system permease protein